MLGVLFLHGFQILHIAFDLIEVDHYKPQHVQYYYSIISIVSIIMVNPNKTVSFKWLEMHEFYLFSINASQILVAI